MPYNPRATIDDIINRAQAPDLDDGDIAVKDVMQHAYCMSMSETISPDGIMNINAPVHLRDIMDGHTGFGFSSDHLSNPDYDLGGGKALVIWLKRDFWNPDHGSYDANLQSLIQQTDAMVRHLGDKYNANLASYLFSDDNLEKSNTPCALVIAGDLASQDKLHGDIYRDLAAIARKTRGETAARG